MIEDMYLLLEYLDSGWGGGRGGGGADMCAKCRKKSGKENIIYTPTPSPSSDAEPK